MPYQRKLPMLNEIDYMSFIPPEIRQYIPGAKTAATLGVATLPGAGEGMDVQDMAQGMQNAYQGYQQGDYGMMGQGAMDTALGGLSLGAGMATLGFGPSIARMVRGPVMAAPDAARAGKAAIGGTVDDALDAARPKIRAYTGSPHDYAAERLVRHSDGRTEYVVGTSDKLPDVPAGAEVIEDFPLGRARTDKIGTGEGAQAYGHGLYAAENEGVARDYRRNLSSSRNSVMMNGFDMEQSWPVELERYVKNETITAPSKGRIEQAIKSASVAYSDPIDELRRIQKEIMDRMQRTKEPEWALKYQENAHKTEMDFMVSKDVKIKHSGKMYEIDIDADPADFLDWDAPLSEQSEGVRKAYSQAKLRPVDDPILAELFKDEAVDNSYLGLFPKSSGAQAYNTLADDFTNLDAAWEGIGKTPHDLKNVHHGAAEALKQSGIPGIKYHDAGSRAAGEGTRNYVVFDEKLISIVRKYGIAGAAVMLGVSQMDVQEAMAEGSNANR